MLLIALGVGVVIGSVVFVGLGFYFILSQQRRAQTTCDQLCLTIAKSLNEGDRIGQMNAVIERARELVYTSRENENAVRDLGVPAYMTLSGIMLDESRKSAQLIEKERQNQITEAVNNCRKLVEDINKKNNDAPGIFLLSWILQAQPDINQVKFGSIKDTLSSAESPIILSALHELDLKQKYVEPTSNLFRGNIDARLPPPDADIPFCFSALPAQVSKVNVPPRLVNPDVFIGAATAYEKNSKAIQKPIYLTAAAQINGTSSIETSKENKWLLQIVSTASACSALEAP